MKLHSLVISGFKSFPKRTIINFSQGVSAIVGPNGSGKSNIVDAIRWVLGEQNPRFLRAERMEELLFCGNSKGMVDSARVKLRLVECQDMAPPELKDFSQIDIERILFKDGTSRFLLNGKNCRLKEIRYLFLDTGTGARAYSIIDQGRVGQFVTMTPDERRLIIEEAAGIARYRQRRIQALSRMKNTLENLERLEDVIAEVKRQARTLQRQARKAERFTRLRKEEDTLGLMILKVRYLELDEKEQNLKACLEKWNQKSIALETEISGIDLEISRLDMELQGLLDRQRVKRQNLEGLIAQKNRVFKILSSLEKEIALIHHEDNVLKQAQNALESKIHGLSDSISRRRSGLDEDRQGLSLLKEQAKGLEEKIRECSRKVSRLKMRREDTKDQFVVVASRKAQVLERLTSGKNRKSHLEDRLEIMNEKRHEIFLQKERIEEEILRIKKALSSCKDEMREAQKGLQEKEKGLFSARISIERVKREKQKWNSRLSETDARLQALIQIEEEGAGLLETTRLLKTISGSKARIVADLIEVEDEYEELVEAALGQTIQSVVLDEKREMVKILEKVARDGQRLKGASMILSKGLMNDSQTGPRIDNNSFEFLKDKVIGQDPVAQKVRDLLSSWIVVDQMSEVLSLDLTAFFSGRFHIISKDGLVFTPWRELRFVFGERSKDAGLIARKKEIKRLEEERGLILQSLQSITEKEAEYLELENDAQKQVEIAEQGLRNLKKKKGDLEKALYRASSNLQGIEDRLELMEFELDEAKRELDDLLPAISILETALDDVVRQEVELKARLGKLEAELSDGEKGLQQATADKNRWTLEFQELKARIGSGQAELERMEAAIDRAKKEFAKNQAGLKRLADRLRTLHGELDGKKKELESLTKTIEDIEKDLKAIELDMDALREKRFVVEKKRAAIQKELSQVNVEINKLEMDISESVRGKKYMTELCLKQFRRSIDEVLTDEALDSEAGISDLERRLNRLAEKVESFGPVNLMAMEEFNQLDQRLQYLLQQREDVKKSLADIKDAITKIDKECKEKFISALEHINVSLQKVFSLLFDGGRAWLSVLDEKNILETGVEYRLRLPGKRINTLSLLSGGEKALAALALIFAIFLIKPTPFCLLDEVDAPLDEANTLKFNSLVRRISASCQVILVTHNQQVMEMADCLYGVTMEEKGVSKLVTVKMI